MLKKFILLLLLIAVILVGGLPFLDGYWFKQNYLKTIDLWNQNFHQKVQVISYEKGWFRSHVSLKMEADKTNIPLRFQRFSDSPIYIEQTITHGPLVFTPGPNIAAAKIVSNVRMDSLVNSLQPYLGLPPGSGILMTETVVTFNQNYATDFMMSPIVTELPNKTQINWKGLKGHTDLSVEDNRIDQVSSNINVGDLSVEVPNKLYAIKTGTFTTQNNAKISQMDRLWNVQHTSNLSSLSVFVLGKEVVTLNALQFLLNKSISNNNMYNATVNLSVDKLILPFLANNIIHPASINLSIENLSATAIAEFSSLPHDQKAQLVESYYSKILTDSSKAKLDLSINTDNGRLFVTGEAHWPANDLPTTAELVLDKAIFQMEVRVSQKLLNQIVTVIDNNSAGPFAQPGQAPPPGPTMKMQIDNLIAAGYLTADKDDYVSTIVGNQNKITVNGKPFPAPTMPGVGIPMLPGTQPAVPATQPQAVPASSTPVPASVPAQPTTQPQPPASSTPGSPLGQPMTQPQSPTPANPGPQATPMPQPMPMQPPAHSGSPIPSGGGLQPPMPISQ